MKVVATLEHAVKKPTFGCQMCGQCVLHETGLTCPMNCPKTLRNGPCGGVREDGSCEVKPDMRCVWDKANSERERGRCSRNPGVITSPSCGRLSTTGSKGRRRG